MMKFSFIPITLVCTLCACAPVGRIAPIDVNVRAVEETHQRAYVLRTQIQEQARVNALVYRLTLAANLSCPKTEFASGISVTSLHFATPSYREAAAKELGWDDRAMVASVIQGSAADQAGIRAGDKIETIDGEAIERGADAYSRAHAAIDKAAQDGNSIALTLTRNGRSYSTSVQPIHVCRTQAVVYRAMEPFAVPNGEAIMIPSGLLRYVRNEDELAAALAHALAYYWGMASDTLISTSSPEMVVQAPMGSTELSKLHFLDQEHRKIDSRAIHLVMQAGFRSDAVLTYWRRLSLETELLTKTSKLWDKHLASDERLGYLDSMVSIHARRLIPK